MHAALAVAPDEFSRVVDRDDQRNDREGALQRFDHDPRDRMDRVAVPLVGVPERGQRVHEADAEQHDEGGAANGGSHVEPGERPELAPACVAGRLRPYGRCGGGARGDHRRIVVGLVRHVGRGHATPRRRA